VTGFEPATSGSTIRRSNQLSYTHHTEKTLDTDSVEAEILTKTEEAPQPGMTPRINWEETSVQFSFPLRAHDDYRWSASGIEGRLHFRKNGGGGGGGI
jgi:hypothetical protein